MCAHFFSAYLYITQEFIHLYRLVWWVEDYIDDDKDVIGSSHSVSFETLYLQHRAHIINAFVPKQVDIGLDIINAFVPKQVDILAEYTILVCCHASYQIIGIKMSEISVCLCH